MIDFGKIVGFDWDDGNARKNDKHGVSMAEAEQIFFNAPLLLLGMAATASWSPDFMPWVSPTKNDYCTSR